MTAPLAAAPAASAQASQAGLAAVVAAQIPGLLRAFDVHDLRAAQRDITVLLHDLAGRYGAASAALAARQYELARAAAALRRITILPADTAPVDQVAATVRWLLSPMYGPDPNLVAFETKVTGVAEKLVLDTGRRTIIDNVHRDRQATGWARIPEPAACAFCALLATRGAVYKHETAAFRSHDHCKCHAEPVFGDYQAPPEVERWRDLYRSINHGSPAKMRADFRRAYEAQ